MTLPRCSSCGGPVDPSTASLAAQFARCSRCLDVAFDDEESALLRLAMPPLPLSESLIERCVRAAREIAAERNLSREAGLSRGTAMGGQRTSETMVAAGVGRAPAAFSQRGVEQW